MVSTSSASTSSRAISTRRSGPRYVATSRPPTEAVSIRYRVDDGSAVPKTSTGPATSSIRTLSHSTKSTRRPGGDCGWFGTECSCAWLWRAVPTRALGPFRGFFVIATSPDSPETEIRADRWSPPRKLTGLSRFGRAAAHAERTKEGETDEARILAEGGARARPEQPA